MEAAEVYEYFVKYTKDLNQPLLPFEVFKICKDKINTLKETFEFGKPFVSDNFEYAEDYVEKFLKKPEASSILTSAIKKFSELEEYTIESVEKTLRSISEELSLGTNKVFQTVRGALMGRLVTPGLFESVVVLGKEKTLERLNRSMKYIS